MRYLFRFLLFIFIIFIGYPLLFISWLALNLFSVTWYLNTKHLLPITELLDFSMDVSPNYIRTETRYYDENADKYYKNPWHFLIDKKSIREKK